MTEWTIEQVLKAQATRARIRMLEAEREQFVTNRARQKRNDEIRELRATLYNGPPLPVTEEAFWAKWTERLETWRANAHETRRRVAEEILTSADPVKGLKWEPENLVRAWYPYSVAEGRNWYTAEWSDPAVLIDELRAAQSALGREQMSYGPSTSGYWHNAVQFAEANARVEYLRDWLPYTISEFERWAEGVYVHRLLAAHAAG